MRARLLRIEDTRRDEPAFLDSLLAYADPLTRAAAALSAGRLGGRAHGASLRRLAIDRDSAVAANALFSLGLLKDTASASLAVAALQRGTAPAREAAWLLGELGERERPAIESALNDAGLSSATRRALLLAAARLRPVPAAAIVPWITSTDSAVACAAAYAIARGRSATALRALLARSGAPWVCMREQVARGATRSLASDSLATEAQSVLAILVRDPVPHVRINALRSLASFGPRARSALVTSLSDSDVNVRVTAAQSLGLASGADSSIWVHAFDADTTFMVRRSLAEGAIKAGIKLSARAGWGTSTDWQRRAVAAALDGVGSAEESRERLVPWLRDPDGRVRAAAASAVATLADSTALRPAVRDLLRAALMDSDVSVRATSLGALAAGASADDLAAATRSYRSFLGDTDSDARLSFWRLADSALARLGAQVPDSLQRQLAALARPSDPVERARAAAIPRFASWMDDTSVPRPLSWYVSRAEEAARPTAIVLRIQTDRGTMDLSLFASEAPLTVYNVVTLAREGYFNGQYFHRVVPNFVIQAGDPRGDGNGGPGYAIRDEINRRRYERGTLGMALSGPNTGGSQFFVTHSPQPHLDGGYTVFGELVGGFDVLDRIVQGDRIVRVTIQ